MSRASILRLCAIYSPFEPDAAAFSDRRDPLAGAPSSICEICVTNVILFFQIFLEIANARLNFPDAFLNPAFVLKARVANGLARDFLDSAFNFFGAAFDLVCVHDDLQWLDAERVDSIAAAQDCAHKAIWVCTAPHINAGLRSCAILNGDTV